MLSGLPLDDQLQRVSRLPHNSLIIVSSYRSDASGRSTVARDVVQLVASNANAPTFGYGIDWLGTGIVGGDLIQHDLLATRVDDMTARILKGESASAIPLNTEPSTAPIFDARAMARWHVSEAALPVGSTVMFRPPTLWSEHKQLLITGSSIVGVQALFIVALLFEQRRRRVAQTQLSEAEQRYRTVADFTADWEYWVTPNGTFAYLSPSCGSITGYNRDELLERPELLNEMPIDDDRDQWQRCHENAAQSNGPLNFEARIRTKNGNVRWLDVLLSPIASDDGTRLGLRGSARDITSRKQSEAELRQALDENQQLRDRLEVDNAYLREEARRGSGIDGILGSSEVMRYVVSKIQQVAPTSSTVLLLGETGVGKTLLARALHERSSRSARIFVTLNCAAVPRRWSRASSSATKRAPSPAPTRGGWDASNLRLAERCSLTRSANCRWNCRRNCCARFRKASLNASAAASR
jgi:PAS domain S-box-containing protein